MLTCCNKTWNDVTQQMLPFILINLGFIAATHHPFKQEGTLT